MRFGTPMVAGSVGLLLASFSAAVAQPEHNENVIGILLAAGDVSYCPDQGDGGAGAHATGKVIQAEINRANAQQPRLPMQVLALGDLGYPDGTAKQIDCFNKNWDFNDIFLPVPGNHEYSATNNDGAPYFEHFKNLPFVTMNGEKTGYYAVDFPAPNGPWRLIGLNAYVGGTAVGPKEDERRRAAMKVQLDWLEKQVDTREPENRKRCVLAFWHPPLFSSGRHGHYPYRPYKWDSPLKHDETMRNAFQILYRHGATVVLAGHDHNFEQFSPHDSKGKSVRNGIRSFVVGTGGSPLTQTKFKFRAPNSEEVFGRETGTKGVLKIELYADSYSWTFLGIDGKTRKLKTARSNCGAH